VRLEQEIMSLSDTLNARYFSMSETGMAV